MKNLVRCVIPAAAALLLYACTPTAPSTSMANMNPSTAKGDNTPSADAGTSYPDFGPGSDFATAHPADLAGTSSADLGKSSPADLGGTTSGACGAITGDGICMGAKLAYCDDTDQLETIDCTPYGGCVVDATGFADCKNPPTN